MRSSTVLGLLLQLVFLVLAHSAGVFGCINFCQMFESKAGAYPSGPLKALSFAWKTWAGMFAVDKRTSLVIDKV